jgi:glycosyltransferase involved in cell wall biosynthesis
MARRTVLALLPFLARGSLALRVLREVRRRGLEFAVAYTAAPASIALDPAEDLREEGRLVDLSHEPGDALRGLVEREILRRDVGLVLQIGATPLYRHLPYVKEKHRRVRILDTLYNEVGHVVNHFLYERCFDGVIVESRHMRRYVERCSANPALDVRVVENGIDLEAFQPAPRPAVPRGLVLGFVGRMSQEKNPLGFVELCERLHRTVPGLSFRMAGDGPLADDVRRRVEASPARAAFTVDGHRGDVAAVMNGLDALVVPSRLDGRPNAILEANACGVPVLAAPVGGIPELVEDGRNGYLLTPERAADVAALLATWRAEPERLAALRTSSREVAEARFDQRRMLDRYEALFREQLD